MKPTPIVTDPQGNVIQGNGRALAAKQAGIQVPIEVQYDLAKPSQRILFALEALEEFERGREENAADMSVWFDIQENKCFACLGGAALMRMHGVDMTSFEAIDEFQRCYDTLYPHMISHGDFETSLDWARVGNTKYMFAHMDLAEYIGGAYSRDITPYRTDKEDFMEDMRDLAADLAADGY